MSTPEPVDAAESAPTGTKPSILSDDVPVDGTEEASASGPLTAGPSGDVVVVGGGQVGRLLARRLAADRPVRYVDDDRPAVERAARRHDATFVRDLTDRHSLAGVVDDTSHVVVATSRDATNLLVAQHCLSTLCASRVVALVTDPRTTDAYPPGVERVCATTALTTAVADVLGGPEGGDDAERRSLACE